MLIEKPKIWVVESNPKFNDQLMSILGQKYCLYFYEDLEEFLKEKNRVYPELVLLDACEQAANRRRMYAQLLNELQPQLIPLVLIVDSEEDEILEWVSPGAVDFVTQPIHEHILWARVHTLLERKQLLDHSRSKIDCTPEIPSQVIFDEIFNREWRRALRCQTPQSVIVVEIDFFKEYRSILGQAEAENCLRQTACVLVENAKRETDLVSHHEDNQFVVFLPETDLNGALQVAHHIEEGVFALDLAHPASPISDRVTVSIGIAAMRPAPHQNPAELISSAAIQLNEAKLHGYNRIKC